MKQIVSIQYLRGVAAIMVVIYHLLEANPSEPYAIPLGTFSRGAFGVDIFFVISGFIMWILAKAKPEQPPTFLARRLVRIIPLYWAITLITAFVSIRGLFADMPSPYVLVRSLAFIPQWSPEFDGIIAPIVKVGWTVELELFFYALFAMILYARDAARLTLSLTVFMTLPVIGFIFGPFDDAKLQAYTSSVLLEFAYGILLGALYPRLVSMRACFPNAWILGLALIASSIMVLPENGVFLRTRGIVVGIPALMIVSGGLLMEKKLLSYPLRILGAVGDSSYSIYLFHLMILVITQKTLGVWYAHKLPWFALVSQTMICIVGGYMLYRFIEKPLHIHMRHYLAKAP